MKTKKEEIELISFKKALLASSGDFTVQEWKIYNLLLLSAKKAFFDKFNKESNNTYLNGFSNNFILTLQELKSFFDEEINEETVQKSLKNILSKTIKYNTENSEVSTHAIWQYTLNSKIIRYSLPNIIFENLSIFNIEKNN